MFEKYLNLKKNNYLQHISVEWCHSQQIHWFLNVATLHHYWHHGIFSEIQIAAQR